VSHPSLAQIGCWSVSSCPEFFEEQITEVKEQITEETENVVEFNTPQGPEFVEQVSEVQENITEVRENVTIIE